MKRLVRRAAAALLAAGALASAPGAAAQQPRNLMYRVEGPSGATVYMLGSIHVLTADAYPLSASVERAYGEAERVVFEVNLDSLQARAGEMAPRGVWQNGGRLRDAIPADLYAQVEQASTRYPDSRIDMSVLDRLEPWMVALLLSQLEWARADLQARHGIDVHFEARAQRDGKGMGALESVDFQLGLMDGFSPGEQEEMLRQALDGLPRTEALMRDMVAAWRAGDAAGLDTLVNGSMGRYPAFYDRMLTDRNAAWIPQIEQLIRGRDDVLVIVGAAHLVGDESVVAMLRARGYTVEQV
jgi:uncharacterized protein YbaP (TraB family)